MGNVIQWLGRELRHVRTGSTHHHAAKPHLSYLWIGAIALLSLGMTAPSAYARNDELPPNPLTLQELDPTVPPDAALHPLSASEQQAVMAAADQRQAEGDTAYAEGDLSTAFEHWFEELRLRQSLGVDVEVAALDRVGQIAWRESQGQELGWIVERLQLLIQPPLPSDPEESPSIRDRPLSLDQQLAIAQTLTNLKAQPEAIAAYRVVVERAQQQRNSSVERQSIQAIADLYLGWFDYPNAAIAYEDLLTLAQQQGDDLETLRVLEQLTYIYQQDQQYESAIIRLEDLVERYTNAQQLLEIPRLQLAIATSYLAIERPDLAAHAYQEAFTTASANQQFGYASDALRQLGELYQSLQRWQDALVVYQLLIQTEQQSYSSYGVMTAYDQIGQIYQQTGETALAMNAFRQGLQLARELHYREDYFLSQINQLTQPEESDSPVEPETPGQQILIIPAPADVPIQLEGAPSLPPDAPISTEEELPSLPEGNF